MDKRKKALELLSYMVEVSEGLDLENREANSLPESGDGWMTFHLKLVKELINDDD